MRTQRSDRRWAHVTYASFRNLSGRGGWHVGPSVNAGHADEQLVTEYAPTSLVPTRPFDDFIGASEIEELPRRFEYLPFGDRGLFMQSVPAGKDATGRPGNVFTHAVIDHDLTQPLTAVYPINLYRSPDLRTPFRMASVNAVELPPQLAEPQVGPLADLAVAWMMVNDMLGDRTGALHRLQDVLSEGRQLPVLVVKNPNEAAYWLQALSSTLSPLEARRLLRFSTFERAASLPAGISGAAHPVVVVPAEDRQHLQRSDGICVIDPADPQTHATAPGSTWSQLTQGVFNVGLPPVEIVARLTAVTADLDGDQLNSLRFGDGLARLARARPALFDTALARVAELHLAERRPATGPAAAAGNVRDNELALLRRVIDRPELAREAQAWPTVKQGDIPDHLYFQLVDDAIAGLDRLTESSADTLINYLDFLLHTRLALRENIKDPAFRGKFSSFPALRQWRETTLPAGAHAGLEDLLQLAEQDRRVVEDVERRKAEQSRMERHRAERPLRQLSWANSIGTIVVWLGQEKSLEKLRRLSDERVIQNSHRDYTADLMRVYFTVNIFCQIRPIITGDRDHDLDLNDVLATLALIAVHRHATTGEVSLTRFQQLGQEIARGDIRGASRDQKVMKKARILIAEHRDPNDLPFGSAPIREIFAAVAQGILAELEQHRKDNN